MGVIVFFALLIVCWLVPPFLILRTRDLAGWTKARWVLGCVAAALTPLLISGAIGTAAFYYGRTARDFLFGPGAWLAFAGNTASYLLPWIVYAVFRRRHAVANSTESAALASADEPANTKTRKRWPIVVSAIVALIVGLWWGIPTYRKAQADALVDELCAKDGGVKVYEVVKLPANGERRRVPLALKPDPKHEYWLDVKSAPVEPYSAHGDISVVRQVFSIYRTSDNRLLGEAVSYLRRGGDGLLPLHPSSHRCPANVGLERSVFIRN